MNTHLIIICNEYPPFGGGGIGTFYKTLAESLVDHGYSVTVGGIYSDIETVTKSHEQGVEIWRLPSSPNRRGRYRLNMILDRWRIGRWVRSQVVQRQDTLIDCADYHGWMWGVPNIAPRIIRIHGADTIFMPLLNRQFSSLKRYFEINSLRRADYIISSSQFMTKQVELVLGPKRTVDQTIYNMVDTECFCPCEYIQRDPLTVASVSSITRKKGVFQLLEAWRIVIQHEPNAKLIYYGRDTPDGTKSTVEALKHLAYQYGIMDSISFAGSWPYNDLVNVFRQHGTFVFPSYIEAHPRAWLEAMATGAPVIGSNRGPGVEVIEHDKTGLIIDPDNIQQLAEAILRLINDRKLSEQLGKSARQAMLGKFAVEPILKKNIEFYRSCLSTYSDQ